MSSIKNSSHRQGSLWNRWDLHFHTPSSFDYENKSLTNQALVDGLIAANIRVVAVTDHHVVDIARIREMQRLGGKRLTVLPGIELRSDQGGEPIHYICIFPEDCDLEHVATTIQGSLGLTSTGISEKGGDQRVYVPLEQGAELARKLGGIVTIHAGTKSNSIENIRNREQFQQRIKADITEKWVDLMEIGQIKDIDVHLKMIFPAIGITKPLIICSDNHDVSKYTIKAPLWFRATPGFRGLLMVLREPLNRVFIGERPDDLIKIEQNPTKYIASVSFARRSTAPNSQKWFSGKIEFNPGLVAIIGNKGSGKSALSDTIGLLGASKNSNSFSFLSKGRFRHPSAGFASFFDATIEWASGEKATRCLSDSPAPEELERVKYLPQDHVERVCNELASLDEKGFERELKSVIFSHVPEATRLSQTTLDDLVRFQTGEKQKRIDTLLKELRETSRARSRLESQADPNTKRELEEKIKRRELEIEALNAVKPAEKPNPATSGTQTPPDSELLTNLSAAEGERNQITGKITEAENSLKKAERRLAVARRLIEKLDNFEKSFQLFQDDVKEDAKELDLDVSKLIAVTVNHTDCESIQTASLSIVQECRSQLDQNQPQSLKKLLEASQKKIAQIQANLDAPNRAYQAYRKELATWEEKRAKLEGNENDPESLKGLRASVTSWVSLPEKVTQLQTKQSELALDILTQKAAQVEVYRTFYSAVQNFINSHSLAKDKLKLEFRAELVNQGFEDNLLGILALNRRGSFFGSDQGRSRLESITESVVWSDKESVRSFLAQVDRALHFDLRDTEATPVQLADQLPRGRTPEDVFELCYGLTFVQPRYVLRWEGKDISMLSPGERGTLLLVFYLLIDNGDTPLLIDQPEGNLDNQTVAKVLVDCIREARKRRQVFIVTHNPNIAVVCDADQVVYADINKSDGNAVTYTAGALEDPLISKHVTDVLEGTRWAFGVRGAKYEVGSEA